MKSKARNRILSLGLAMALVVGAMITGAPLTAYAAMPAQDSTAIGEPYDGVDFGDLIGEGIYYGTYDHATSLSNGISGIATKEGEDRPVLWRVMGEEGNEGYLTLLSEYALDSAAFDDSSHVYDTSDIKDFLGAIATGIFNAGEAPYAKSTTDVTTRMHDIANGAETTGTQQGTNYPVTTADQILYLPWGKYSGNGVYWDAGNTEIADNKLSANYSGNKATLKYGTFIYYWLRSPYQFSSGSELRVEDDGLVSYGSVDRIYGVRPAFKLNPSSIIFASKIADNAVEANGETQSNSDYSHIAAGGGDANFKLTIVNNSLTLSDLELNSAPLTGNGTETLTVEPGGTLDLNGDVNGATKMAYKIVDRASGEIVGYGVGDSTSLTVNGIANMTTGSPNLTENGNYTLYVWAQNDELINSNEGSAPMHFTLDVQAAAQDTTPPTILSINPAASATDAAISGDIEITFSEAIGITGTVSLDGGLTSLDTTGESWTAANTVYTIPYSGLDYSTDYTITIAGFKDMAGNAMVDDDSYGFTTRDIPDGPDVDPTSLDITTGQSKTFTVSFGQSGNEADEATVTSDDTSVATVDIVNVATSGTTVTVTGVFQGSTDITVAFSGGSYAGGDKTVHVTVTNPAPEPPDPPDPPEPQPVPPDSSSDSGGSSYKPTISEPAIPSTLVVDAAKIKAALAEREKSGANKTRIRHNGEIKVSAELWPLFEGIPVNFDTVDDGAVQVRVTIREPGKMTGDKLLSGYVKGSTVDSRKAFFEKRFKNKLRAIHFDQQGDFGQPVEIAAKIDLTAMDTDNLVFYSYDKKTNTYKRIENPAYWIDKNGYLHFTTEYAGDIIISEEPLERK